MLQTVRIWQGSEDGNYNCNYTLKDHTAEVNNFDSTYSHSDYTEKYAK